MTLEEKLRAYAAKGELVYLSLAFTNDTYVARFTAASPGGGYASGYDPDPVEAIEKALKASPAKPARVSKPKDEVTATVTDEPFGETAELAKGGFSQDWTAP